MTYSEIKELAYDILGDDQLSPKIFTSEMMDMFANMAVRSINESRILEKRKVIPVVAGTALYDLPADSRRVYRVTYDGVVISPLTEKRLNQIDDTWRNRTGTPVGYYFENEQIGLYPIPTVSTAYSMALDQEYGVVISEADQEFGVIVDTSVGDGLSFDQEYGVLINSIDSGHLEVFYWATPDSVNGEGQPDVPDWAWPGVLEGILALAYQADTLDRDYAKSRAYEAMFGDCKRRIDARASNTIPKTYVARKYSYQRGMDILKDRTRRTYTVPE